MDWIREHYVLMVQFPSQTSANGLWTLKKVNRNLQGSNFPTFPGAPTIGTATGGNAQASVTFTAPASTGGSSITSYTVTSSPGGLTGTGASSPITVTGLTNGTAYTFTVQATSFATGPASAASNSVTPSAVVAPSSVEYLVVAGGGGGAADDGGGGGAGGFLTASGFSVSTGSAITVTVGGGGTGAPRSSADSATAGSNSVFGSITSTGGGAGHRGGSAPSKSNGGSGGVGGILAVLEEQALLGRQGRGITVAMLLIQALAAVVVRVLLALMELQMDVVMKHQPVMGVMELHLQFQEAL